MKAREIQTTSGGVNLRFLPKANNIIHIFLLYCVFYQSVAKPARHLVMQMQIYTIIICFLRN